MKRRAALFLLVGWLVGVACGAGLMQGGGYEYRYLDSVILSITSGGQVISAYAKDGWEVENVHYGNYGPDGVVLKRRRLRLPWP